ncbi:MAG: hypothetical protein HN778_12950 [Prolixibacteraceae bacterium]|jgi:hypothetical protein|nr:hypothetical protein [Prolixibacteraceae bacterium]MBT6006134.1 hypothetical protein [Prolixibacteraceae bacterium]MBT6765067.1 hypothetical protein [Prolixibacteraceae bacterium]MBT6998551.1 hypothetical protein [Prolixibacteraceae bacterium]MBT7395735.1 hypothetical protein [Prolixibacteraceae bacterium]
MKTGIFLIILAILASSCISKKETNSSTRVSIKGEKFYINGKPTFEGRTWEGISVEGLLPNSRMVQGIFDDLNPETVVRWDYPDGKWSADRNTNEFVAAMDDWRAHGLLAFTVNMQGGSPMGYGNKNWYNSAYFEDGKLREDYMLRLDKILKKADEIGMVPILGLFYFGQDQNLKDETAVVTAVDNSIAWLLEKGYKNVIIELGNESNNRSYDHEILKKDRVHELIIRAKEKAPEMLVSTSFNGNTLPPEKVVEVSDYVLIHGNGVHEPARITEMVEQVRAMSSYTPKPIVFNEDDHFDFDKPINNYANATRAFASWGYFDFRMGEEGYDEGYQSVPVNWGISSERKKGFFKKTKEIFVD